jgi:hypothetical protein
MSDAKSKEALRIAEEVAKQSKSATDFHNIYFGIGGKFGKLFPTRPEREAFAKTPEYQAILRIRAGLGQAEKVAFYEADCQPSLRRLKPEPRIPQATWALAMSAAFPPLFARHATHRFGDGGES